MAMCTFPTPPSRDYVGQYGDLKLSIVNSPTHHEKLSNPHHIPRVSPRDLIYQAQHQLSCTYKFMNYDIDDIDNQFEDSTAF